MITKETKELAQLAYDAYFKRIGTERIQLDEATPKVRDAWIASVAAIKEEVEKKYAGCLVAGEPSVIEPEQTSEGTSIPSGFIFLRTDFDTPLYVRALDITAICEDQTEASICFVYTKSGDYRCKNSIGCVASMIAKVIGTNRNG